MARTGLGGGPTGRRGLSELRGSALEHLRNFTDRYRRDRPPRHSTPTTIHSTSPRPIQSHALRSFVTQAFACESANEHALLAGIKLRFDAFVGFARPNRARLRTRLPTNLRTDSARRRSVPRCTSGSPRPGFGARFGVGLSGVSGVVQRCRGQVQEARYGVRFRFDRVSQVPGSDRRMAAVGCRRCGPLTHSHIPQKTRVHHHCRDDRLNSPSVAGSHPTAKSGQPGDRWIAYPNTYLHSSLVSTTPATRGHSEPTKSIWRIHPRIPKRCMTSCDRVSSIHRAPIRFVTCWAAERGNP